VAITLLLRQCGGASLCVPSILLVPHLVKLGPAVSTAYRYSCAAVWLFLSPFLLLFFLLGAENINSTSPSLSPMDEAFVSWGDVDVKCPSSFASWSDGFGMKSFPKSEEKLFRELSGFDISKGSPIESDNQLDSVAFSGEAIDAERIALFRE
jgi:hypothetical protein